MRVTPRFGIGWFTPQPAQKVAQGDDSKQTTPKKPVPKEEEISQLDRHDKPLPAGVVRTRPFSA